MTHDESWTWLLLLRPSRLEHSSIRPSRHYWYRYIPKTTQECTFWSCLQLTIVSAPGRVVMSYSGALQISRWSIDWLIVFGVVRVVSFFPQAAVALHLRDQGKSPREFESRLCPREHLKQTCVAMGVVSGPRATHGQEQKCLGCLSHSQSTPKRFSMSKCIAICTVGYDTAMLDALSLSAVAELLVHVCTCFGQVLEHTLNSRLSCHYSSNICACSPS